MVGKLDKEIIEKFEEFQEKTGKHGELYLEDVEFEEKALKYIANFPAMTRISGGIDKSISEYKLLLNDEKNNYKPLISGTVENNQISGYVHINRLSKNSLSKENIISWTRINSEVFFIQKNPVCTNDDSFVMEIKKDYIIKYVQLASMVMMKYKQFNWGNKAGKTKVKEVEIPIPKDLNKFYSSYQIQEAIVEFFEYSFDEIETIKERIDKRYKIFERLKKALIPSTFIKDYVKVAFGRYAKENGIGFNITDVEFEIKRIHSDKKDDSDVICKKRMGFTPKTSKTDDINWFRVEDLNDINGLYIDEPNTIKKTTMSKVIAKNGKTSSKNVSIGKGDILVSFLATPGIVKIYNSDKISYCNQALDILTPNKGVNNRYLAYNCMLEYPKYGKKQTMGVNLDNSEKMKIKIYIPKDLEDYNSLKIQKIIADFIEYTENRLQKEFDRMDEGYHNLKRLHKTYLARTFSLIDWGVK
jgi:hypothetical protein